LASQSSRSIERRDGSLEACRARGATEAPREGCAAVVRVELTAIGESSGTLRFAGAAPRGAAECTLGDPNDCPRKCDAGSTAACFWLGRMLHDGNGVAKDVFRAQELFTKACAAGEGRACFALGFDLTTGTAGKRDLPRAASLFERGCMLGEDNSCTLYGIDRLRADFPKAESLLARACERGADIACASLGGAYVDRGDRVSGQRLLDRGCTLGYAVACTRARWLRAGGVGEMPVK
jgi:hypothetical protein